MLKKENMTVIICQSKNDRKYSTTPKRYLFSTMNPFTLGIFDKGTDPPPIIQMVYALAARQPVVPVMQRGGRPYLAREAKVAASSSKHTYTSFDIWCGHTSSATFGAIQDKDNDVYKNLLKYEKHPEHVQLGPAIRQGGHDDHVPWSDFAPWSLEVVL